MVEREELAIYETCSGCGREFAYPHLCRTHQLCGLCHPALLAEGG